MSTGVIRKTVACVNSVNPLDLEQLINDDLAQRAAAHQLRRRRVLEIISPTRVRLDGVEYINFASNNYLGLTHHPRLIEAGRAALESAGAGSGAAGLITGHSAYHESAERAIAAWKGTQGAVILPSGYQANLAAIQTLAALNHRAQFHVLRQAGTEHRERSDQSAVPDGVDCKQHPIAHGSVGRRTAGARFLIDKLSHASLIDAVRASGAEFRIFPHTGMNKLARLLEGAPENQLQVVLTESIFSMDGDAADLAGLAKLKAIHKFVLVLDEAHGSGVYGQAGAGYASEMGLQSIVDVSIVTLSKALGGSGGAVCGSAGFCAALLNHGRAYIYSTAVSPASAAIAEAAVGVMRDEPQLQARVRELARRIRAEAARLGLAVPAGDSPIVPIILGSEETALAASARLMEMGLLVPAVRPPTVPRGGSRLRVTVSAGHGEEEVGRLVRGLEGLEAR